MKRLSILTMVALLAGVASYAQPGTLDPTFNAAQALPAGSHLFALALQPDGKLIGGSTLLNRFHDDGSLDLSYNINRAFFNGTIGSLRLQPDNKLLVGGIFSQFGGQPAGKLIRLNDDGTRDLAFNAGGAGFTTSSFFMFLPAIEIQPDGKILAGGGFSAYNGVSQNRLSRLNPDGSLDATFNIGTGFDYDVNDIVYHNGKILVGGNFMNYKGVPAQNLIRLEENGNVDNSFNIKAGFNFGVNEIAIQPDGKIVVIGAFKEVDGIVKNGIVRLHPDGGIDTSFKIGSGLESMTSALDLLILPNGKIVVVGQFTTYNGAPANGIVRLNEDGSKDADFITGTGAMPVAALALQPDLKIFIAGGFDDYNGISRNRIARLNGDDNIRTTVDSIAEFCADPAVEVSFLATGTFNSGNVFTAELSDAAGSFAAPVEIGAVTGTTSGTIIASIPQSTPSGNGYRIRVVSSSPVVTGSDNGEDLVVNNVIPAEITVDGYELGTTLAYDTYQWLLNEAVIDGADQRTYTVTENGDYRVIVSDTNGCVDTSGIYRVNNIDDTHIESMADGPKIKIYPNPADDIVHVSTMPINVTLTNIAGQTLKKATMTRSISVKGLTSGMYFLQIFDQEGRLIKVEKLSKN